MADEDKPERNYEVGYGRPPKRTQFKPGQSGNPRGRQKKSKNVLTLLEKELDEIVTLHEGSQQIRITKREAIIKQLVNSAIKGNTKPLQLMLQHLERHREPAPFVSTAADDAELLKYAKLPIAGREEGNNGQS